MPIQSKPSEEISRVAIRFAGDSGDGIQLTGSKFTDSTALAGNDISTFPDFPAEIRAPAGSLAGVSGCQVHFAADDIRTLADSLDVLVALNPAALRANIDEVRPGGMVIVNSDAFTRKNLERAGYQEDPLPVAGDRFKVVEIPLTTLNREALKDLKLGTRETDRCKNFVSNQEVRRCPGCGDYSILSNIQKVMPEFDIPRENVSPWCSARSAIE